MIEVKLEDGRLVQFPDDSTKEEIQQFLDSQFPYKGSTPEASTPNFAAQEYQRSLPGGKKVKDFMPDFKKPTATEQELLEETLPKATGPELTPATVLEDAEAMSRIRKYMTRFGGRSADTPDDVLVDEFLNRQRKYAAGHSIVTIDELLSLQKASDEDLLVATQAYDTFDRFSGVFSDEYTWGEMFDGLGDYARAAILDPINLVGLGVGRGIATAGTKSATYAAKQMAAAAAEKAMKKKLVAQLQAKGAKKVLEKGARGATQKAALASAQQAGKVAERQVLRTAAQNATVGSALKRQAVKSAAIATGVDSTLAVGVDLAYQEGMILSGRQEDWNPYQSGLVALSGIAAGAVSTGMSLRSKSFNRESKGILEVIKDFDFVGQPAQDAAETLSQSNVLQDILKDNFQEFSKRVASGRALTEEGDLLRGVNEQEFFRFFLLGNDDAGVKGIAHALAEAGVKVPERPRYKGDNVTSFIADTLVRLPKAQKDSVLDTFKSTVGSHLPDYKNASMEDIANLMSYQTSVAGQQLNIFSNVSKVLGKEGVDEATGEFTDTTVETAVSALTPSQGRVKLFKQSAKKFKDQPQKLAYAQNMLIQSIVTHPGTTALNIIGSSYRTVMDTTSDIVKGAIYSGIGMRGFVTGNMDDLNRGVNLIKGTGRRVVNLVRPNATKAEVDDYLAIRPEVEKVLFRYLSGGVENDEAFKAFNLDKASKFTQSLFRGSESTKDFFQKLYLTQAQDRVFKTHNFMYHLDQNVRKEFGVSYSDFMRSPEAAKLIQSEKYATMELQAVEETLSSVFSKSYSSRETFGQNPIHAVATIIEDVRKIPIIGATLPFGQFFNNTVDMMADYSGAKLGYRFLGFGEGRSKDALVDAFSKFAVGSTIVGTMALKEMDYLEQGLGVFEERADDGAILSKQYDFPESFFKMIARGVAYQMQDREIPDDLLRQAAATFGPEAFTRNITDSLGGISDVFGNMFDEGIVSGIQNLATVVAEDTGSAWISGYTRPLDPLNQIAGLFKEGGPTVIDRNQGMVWLNKSSRYVDQFVGDLLLDLGSEEKQSASQGTVTPEIGKLVGIRSVPRQSYIQRMMNGVEKPNWQAGFAGSTSTGNKKLDNRLNDLVFDIAEAKAARLVLSKNWKGMSTSQRKKAVQTVWSHSREEARKNLMSSAEIEDFKLSRLDTLLKQAGSEKMLNQAMKNLGLDREVHEYNAFQLEAILQEVKDLKKSEMKAPFMP